MKKEYVYLTILLAVVGMIVPPVLQDLGYTYRLANYIREKIGKLPVDIDDILGHN